MVPDSERTRDSEPGEAVSPPREAVSRADGGEPAAAGFDEAALYIVVRDAVKDALLDVIGTLLLVGVAFVLVIAGVQAVFSSVSPGTIVTGIGVIAVGLYLAAATLGVIPPIRDWF